MSLGSVARGRGWRCGSMPPARGGGYWSSGSAPLEDRSPGSRRPGLPVLHIALSRPHRRHRHQFGDDSVAAHHGPTWRGRVVTRSFRDDVEHAAVLSVSPIVEPGGSAPAAPSGRRSPAS